MSANWRNFRRLTHDTVVGRQSAAASALMTHFCTYGVDEKRKLARPGTIAVAVGEPISMEGLTRKQIPEIMERVRLAMQAEIDGWNRRTGLP